MQVKIKGLSSEEVLKSKELYGDNSLHKEKGKGFFSKFIDNLSDPIIKILLIALGVQIIFTIGNINYIEIFGIVAAILISTTVSTASEYRSEKAFEKLQTDSSARSVSVLREGKIIKICADELVVGDIVYLSVGEKINADGPLISGKISVDQSALNGESTECRKTPGNDSLWELSSLHKLFRGSIITEGSGIMQVERVGEATYYGMVARDVQAETRVSPLKLRLTRLASQISRIGYAVAAMVGLAYLFNAFVVDNGFDTEKIFSSLQNTSEVFTTLIHALTLMITVIVVAAPEGLPMMITVVLSANMKRMLIDNILVKKLVGIETAGSMNILFTDKTGTLTVGKPECERIITACESVKTVKALRRLGKIYDYLCLSATYNSDIVKLGGEIVGGNGTDRGIYEYFKGEDVPEARVTSKTPFSSERKYSAVKIGETVLIKGAAEMILSGATKVLLADGSTANIDKEHFVSEYLKAAREGQRVVAVAICEEERLTDLTFVGMIVMKDKLRRKVVDSVAEMRRAGIQIVMITGDCKETATAIATECGIFNSSLGHIVLTSEELHKLDDGELKEILPRLRVVSRALPQDKLRLVRVSQELELVVGMTGDGINDAPALKLADVGFAMGSGTDIAKSASDIVIVDNSFSAIDQTVLYGRTIFKSIRKFITFQLIMNFVACGVSLVGQFVGIDTPITIIQMLWINIIMDTLGGLAFAGEAPLRYYMNEKPKRRDEPLLSKEMLTHIFITGAFTLGMCILFLTSFVFKNAYGFNISVDKFYTAFYALFVFFGIFNCFAARCERVFILSNIGKNKLFVVIMVLISAIQIFMIYYGGEVFRCTPLTYKELSLVLFIALTVIPFDIIRRIVYKLK